MKSAILFLLIVVPLALAQGPSKPVVFIYGNGLTNVQANGIGAGTHGVGAATGSASVGRTDGVMELSRVLLKDCPDLDITLDDKVTPDYYMGLNVAAKGGFIWTVELAQVMVANAHKAPIYSEQGTTQRLTKRACKAITADWKQHGPHTAQATTPKSNWNITDKP
jgi:hypothetical protein